MMLDVSGIEIGKCPKCQYPIGNNHILPWCNKCTENLPDSILTLTKYSRDKTATQHSTPQSRALQTRYDDAYLVANAVDGYGGVIKAIGVLGAVILCLLGVVWLFKGTGSGPEASFAFGMGILTIMFGLFVGVLIFVIGVLISAQGQVLKASLDNAVNNSPFLTNEDRAKIMSLPQI